MGYCRPCNHTEGVEWRKRNPEQVKQNNVKQRQLFAQRISDFKAGKPCQDCGGFFPEECMDFDHLRDKKFQISWAVCLKWSVVLEEIAKCDLVCANCHRIRTKKRICPKNPLNQ